LSKKNKMIDLLCAGLNEIISQGKINLKSLDDVEGSVRLNIFGKNAKISWHGVGYGEIRITIWWGVKPECKDSQTTKPLNRNLKDALDFCCSAFLERKNGLWLQGKHGKQLFDVYCARSAESELLSIPNIKPNGYKKERNSYL